MESLTEVRRMTKWPKEQGLYSYNIITMQKLEKGALNISLEFSLSKVSFHSSSPKTAPPGMGLFLDLIRATHWQTNRPLSAWQSFKMKDGQKQQSVENYLKRAIFSSQNIFQLTKITFLLMTSQKNKAKNTMKHNKDVIAYKTSELIINSAKN